MKQFISFIQRTNDMEESSGLPLVKNQKITLIISKFVTFLTISVHYIS